MLAIEKIEVEDNLSYGGLDNLKEWLDEKKNLMRPEVKELLLKKGIKPPRGVLLLGVSGCGKSLSAKEIAKSHRGSKVYLMEVNKAKAKEKEWRQWLKDVEQKKLDRLG